MITSRTALVVLLVTKLYTCQLTSVRDPTPGPDPTPSPDRVAISDGFVEVPSPLSDGELISISTAEQTATFTTQSKSATQEALPLLITPHALCAACYIAMATSSGTVQAAADIVVTAYSNTSAYSSDGVCITTSGMPVMLSEAYTITSPTTVPRSDFPAYAASEFVDFLGFSTCVGVREELFPTPIIQVTNISVTPAPSASLRVGANSTTSPTLHSSNATKPIVTHRLDERAKIVLDVAAFFALLILILLVAFIWHKRRLRSATITAEKQGEIENKQEGTSASEGDNQPYLQQKAELEAEERQRHELEARQKIYELDGQTGINEIPAGTHEDRIAVMRSRQELTGGEHSQELET